MSENKSLDDMEKDLEQSSGSDSEISTNPWDNRERKEDEFSDRDGESRIRLYTLSIDNNPTDGEKPNPKFRKILMDREGRIAAREVVRCAVLDRVISRVCQVPFKQSEKMPKDEPWRKYLGYSTNGKTPSHDGKGNYFKNCKNPETNKPYSMCSLPTRYEDGDAVIEKLKDGECPWGKWPNTMIEADRKKFNIPIDDTPNCNETIIFYCWDFDLSIMFAVYFKVKSLATAKEFIASCTQGFGDNKKKYPFEAFEALITVKSEQNYSIPVITNTNKFNSVESIAHIKDYFMINRDKFVRNLAVQMAELKEKKEKETEFKTNA